MHLNNPLAHRIAERIKSSSVRGTRGSTGVSAEEVRCISFHDYMAMCLYDERDGYYQSGRVRLGRSGDFYTSSAVGTIFGEKLAAYISALMGAYRNQAAVAEWGAGTGRLSAQLRATWQRQAHPWLSDLNYAIVDANPVHLKAAKQLMGRSGCETLSNSSQVTEGIQQSVALSASLEPCQQPLFLTPDQATGWLHGLAASSSQLKPVIVVANELLDAFPVHRVAWVDNQLWELGVALSNNSFTTVYMEPSSPLLLASLEADGLQLREGQETEINLAAESWLAQMSEQITEGALVIIDYGHEAGELRAEHRMRGSLLCYSKHLAHDDPYLMPGEQDITAHVNFTACKRAAEASGWKVASFMTQKEFLIEQGVLHDLMSHADTNPFSEIARHNRSIRQLLLSDQMSETFKVLTLHKVK